MSDTTFLIAFASLTFLIAGAIKGAIGIGLPTAAISILSQGIDAKLAVALVVIPSLVSNSWQIYRMGDTLRAFSTYWIFATVLVSVLFLTTALTASISSQSLLVTIGVVIILFSVTNLLIHPPRLPDRFDRLAQFVAGGIAGLLGGLTAIWAPPLVIYLIARRVERDEFVRATGLLIFIGSVPLLLGFWLNGLIDAHIAMLSAGMVLPALAGFQIGEALRTRLPVERFQAAVLWFFLLMGLNVIRRAVFG